MDFEEIYDKIKRAVTLEIKYQYIDFDGRRTYFSKFMLETLNVVLKRIHKTEKQNISYLIALFESYHVDGLSSRRFTIDKTLETFSRLKKLIKPKDENVEKKMNDSNSKKEFQEEIDDIDVNFVKGVGPKVAKLFNKMNIFKVKDLIEYYPRKYVDYKGENKIRNLVLGESVTIYGTIKSVRHYTSPKKLTVFTIIIQDSTGSIPVNFFLKTNSRALIERYKENYPVGALVMALGKVKFDDYSSSVTLDKAQIQVIGSTDGFMAEKSKIMPIYPLSENVNSKTLTTAINNALSKYKDKIYETLPDYILKEQNFISKYDAIVDIHNPKNMDEIDNARRRLVFEELFSMQLNLALLRKQTAKDESLKLEIKNGGLTDNFIKNLPFELTNAQKNALADIFKDLNSATPMQRLLQGDVGSGKTVVACAALLCAIENGYQGAIMAPTEILATQHYRNFSNWLTPLGLSVGFLSEKIHQK